jgi:hypothetical protein
MEHAEETGKIGADVFRVLGEFFDGLGGSLKQGGVAEALVLAYESAQLFGDGKGDQEVMARELALDAGLEPLLSFGVLAGGAVAITAGNKELLWLSTAFTLVERDAAGLSPTRYDRIDDFAMGGGDVGSIAYSGPKVEKISRMEVMIESLHDVID